MQAGARLRHVELAMAAGVPLVERDNIENKTKHTFAELFPSAMGRR
jgi:hypothetical protein